MTNQEQNYLKSIELLPAQIKQAYQEAGKIKLPKSSSQINKIVACGMGGSQLGVDFVKHVFTDKIKVPIIQVRGYDLPQFIDGQTLIILISYSGNTEEVISIISNFEIRISKQSQNQKSKIRNHKFIIITSGGKLAEVARKNSIPAYIFKPINNPSGQPRMGTGYIIGSLLSILKRLKLINIKDNQIKTLFKSQIPNPKSQTNSNHQIFKIQNNVQNKIPIIVASEFLQGNAHIMANQINESSKQLAIYYSIPELNHHLLEGLTFPKSNQKNLYFLFFQSKLYHPRNQKRYKITQEILKKQRIPFSQIEFKGNKVRQAIQMLKFGSYLSYELTKVNRMNPNEIPWVNYFKKRLS